MLQKLLNFLLYNETRAFLQKNMLVTTQIGCLYFLVPIIRVFVSDKYSIDFIDIIMLATVILIAIGIKKYHTYYVHIVFLIAIPGLNCMAFMSMSRYGALGAFWSFAIIAAFFYIFYRKMAIIAVAITLIITIASVLYNVSQVESIVRIFISLMISTSCISMVFINFYRQYDILQDRVIRDPLTGLLNRSMLKELLLTSILQQKKDLAPVLLYIDIDNFKNINDTFGHDAGDNTLMNIAVLFKNQIRKTDTVFRLGGEEFLILLNNLDKDNAIIIAEKICKTVANADLMNNGHQVTASIGLAISELNEEWNIWLKRADDAMYQAKITGKNKVVVAD